MKLNWLIVLRDVLMVLVIGTFGTLLLKFLVHGLGELALAVVMLSVGFCISGCLVREGRFKHLLVVALGVWLLRLGMGLISRPDYAPSMLIGLVIVFVAMLVGGLLSFAFVRPGPGPSPPPSEA